MLSSTMGVDTAVAVQVVWLGEILTIGWRYKAKLLHLLPTFIGLPLKNHQM